MLFTHTDLQIHIGLLIFDSLRTVVMFLDLDVYGCVRIVSFHEGAFGCTHACGRIGLVGIPSGVSAGD